MWKVIQAVCLLGSLSGVTPQAYDGDIEVNFANYFNEIDEGEQPKTETESEATPPPCSAPEFTKWDKLFTMLENSQMKENMLLQHSDDVVRVELQALRGDLLRLSAQHNGACSASAESHAQRAELWLQQVAEQLREVVAEQRGQRDSALEAVREQAERVESMGACCGAWERTAEQLTSDLQDLAAEVRALRQREGLYEGAGLGRLLPAGCEMALFFPTRSTKSHAEVTAQGSMQTDALTVCLWVKPTQAVDKSALFSYGTSRNPLELQLLVSGRSALFTVGGEAHLVEAHDAVQEGEWVHLCATWDSEHGMAALWVDGREAVRSPGVAEGHQLLGGGAFVLGQDYSCQGLAARFGLHGDSEADLAFAGKMTGVNVWNRVLGEEEISQQAQQDGKACGVRGNLVAWGVSQIVRNGAVELVF